MQSTAYRKIEKEDEKPATLPGKTADLAYRCQIQSMTQKLKIRRGKALYRLTLRAIGKLEIAMKYEMELAASGRRLPRLARPTTHKLHKAVRKVILAVALGFRAIKEDEHKLLQRSTDGVPEGLKRFVRAVHPNDQITGGHFVSWVPLSLL